MIKKKLKIIRSKFIIIKNDFLYLPYARKAMKQFEGKFASDDKPRIYYLGITQNSNLGDWAQIYCTRLWLEQNYPEYEVLEFNSRDVLNTFVNFISSIKKIYKSEDMFFFESGYNINDMGCDHAKMHIFIIRNFPKAKIVFMPSTIYYKNLNILRRDSLGYRLGEKMIFIARDKITEEIAKKMMPNAKIMLYPDIVTSLIGNFVHKNYNRKGICLCLRRDNEKFYTNEQYKELSKSLCKLGYQVKITDTFINKSYKEIENDIYSNLYEEINTFAQFELVITDRFHGTVFSMIAGTPVIVLKTNNHKVTKSIDWFKGLYDDYVYFAWDFKDVEKIAAQINKKEFSHKLNSYFKEHYYNNLKEKIEKIFNQ